MSTNVICRALLCLIVVVGSSGAFAQQSPLAGAIASLLAEADQHLAEDRLTTPVNQNAYDRYKAVLLLDKGNVDAAQGLRAVAERYLAFARSASARHDFTGAKRYLNLAVMVDGRNSRVIDVARLIDRQQQEAKTPVQQDLPRPASPQTQQIFALSAVDLSARNESVKNQLKSLSLRVQDTREYVQIYARNDAEGRWIYQQMRDASKDYRLRGNILRSNKPRIELEPPLD